MGGGLPRALLSAGMKAETRIPAPVPARGSTGPVGEAFVIAGAQSAVKANAMMIDLALW